MIEGDTRAFVATEEVSKFFFFFLARFDDS